MLGTRLLPPRLQLTFPGLFQHGQRFSSCLFLHELLLLAVEPAALFSFSRTSLSSLFTGFFDALVVVLDGSLFNDYLHALVRGWDAYHLGLHHVHIVIREELPQFLPVDALASCRLRFAE